MITVANFAGAPRAIGREHGELYAQRIRELIAIRTELTLARVDLGSKAELADLAGRHLPVLAAADRSLYDELIGIAEGAHVTPADLVILNHYTDLRDLNRGALYEGDEGCSAIFVPGESPVLAQTWDMHASATPFVEIMRFAVTDRPRCLVFSLTGCLGMAGVNEHGVAVTINNLNTPNASVGVLWPALVRLMLLQQTAAEAAQVLERFPVGSGHHYQIADATQFFGIEALSHGNATINRWDKGVPDAELTQNGAAFHTNHCIFEGNSKVERIPDASTTFIRWEALQDTLVGEAKDDLWSVLQDPALSMPPSPSDPHRSATCGGLLVDWSEGAPRMRVARGPLTGQAGVSLAV
jgi:isopenicillin-N N-acyltransferase-like protein